MEQNKRHIPEDNEYEKIKSTSKRVKVNDCLSDDEVPLQIDLNPCPTIYKKRGILVQRPDSFDYVPVTLSNGERRYITKLGSDQIFDYEIPEPSRASEKYYNLLDEAEMILRKKKEACKMAIGNKFEKRRTELWVSKYAPKTYSDLLSSETVNRNLLIWLKSWDKYVFNKDVAFLSKLVKIDQYGHFRLDEDFQLNPIDNRPIRKAVLLSGPPGIGKTTLVQILCRQSGYIPQEMNASDDRNVESIKQKLNSISTNKTIQLDRLDSLQPSLLIIDEIDGMTSAAIQVLVQALIAQPKKSESGENKKQQLMVKRPIICICNDIYAPSLKALRPHCYTIKVDAPDYSMVKARLSDICEKENLYIDSQEMLNLITVSKCDLRSCLNNLQFMKSHNNQRTITLKKDATFGIFDVWTSIFMNLPCSRSKNNAPSRVSEEYLRNHNIQIMVNSCGDIDRVINGIFDNYLSLIRIRDPHLKELTSISDWLTFHDLLSNKILSNQNYELIKYKSFLPSFIHLSFASMSSLKERIHWPMSESNAHFNKAKIKSVFDLFIGKQIRVKSWSQNKTHVLLDILPFLIHIIRPHRVRTINFQLHTDEERKMIINVVRQMVLLGLDFFQMKTQENLFDYILSPPIEDIVLIGSLKEKLDSFQFSATKTAPINKLPPITYALKQLLSSMIVREKIRLTELFKNMSDINPNVIFSGNVPADTQNQQTKNALVSKNKPLKEHLINEPIQSVTAEKTVNRMEEIKKKEINMFSSQEIKKLKTPTSVPRYFSIDSQKKKNQKETAKEENPITNILKKTGKFKFRAGFTDAIRKPVLIKDLW